MDNQEFVRIVNIAWPYYLEGYELVKRGGKDFIFLCKAIEISHDVGDLSDIEIIGAKRIIYSLIGGSITLIGYLEETEGFHVGVGCSYSDKMMIADRCLQWWTDKIAELSQT